MNRRRQFITNAVYFAVIVGIVFLAFRYLLPLIWPFFTAFLFAWLLRPAIRRLTVVRHWRNGLAAILCLVIFFAVLGGLIVLLASRITSAASDLIVRLPTLYEDSIAPGLENLSDSIEELATSISPDVYELAETALPSITSSIGSAVTSLSMRLVSAVSGWAAALPRMLLSSLVCIIATIFITLDFPRITAFLMRQLPEKTRSVVRHAKDTFVTVALKYGKSYGIIMAVTFAEVCVALLILGQKNAGIIAFVIAIFDIFPIVGAWMALVPWAIIELLAGSVGKGIGLLILWVVEVVVRQFIEPRIVGHQVGLHPVVTLIAMYVGLKLFGGVGLLGLPITCAIVQSLDAAGVIHIIKHEDVPKK